METTAVYWEARIRIYGFQEETDLALLDFTLAPEGMVEWGGLLRGVKDPDIPFVLCLMQPSGEEGSRVYILVKRRYLEAVTGTLSISPGGRGEGRPRIIAPVEMIHFQGPHFAERYGIADAAFRALIKGEIPVLAAVCSGASVYLVVGEGMAGPARARLEEVFEVPRKRRPGLAGEPAP